jgi:hypothetical protein
LGEGFRKNTVNHKEKKVRQIKEEVIETKKLLILEETSLDRQTQVWERG